MSLEISPSNEPQILLISIDFDRDIPRHRNGQFQVSFCRSFLKIESVLWNRLVATLADTNLNTFPRPLNYLNVDSVLNRIMINNDLFSVVKNILLSGVWWRVAERHINLYCAHSTESQLQKNFWNSLHKPRSLLTT